MPTYEYRCNSCQHELEAFQSIKDPPLKECPHCKQPALERLISATAFQLKGGGWYKDLYSSSKGTPRTENDRTDRAEKAISDDKKKSDDSKKKSSEAA